MVTSAMKILFWNVNRRDLRSLVVEATVAEGADVIVIIENPISSAATLQTLQNRVSSHFYCPTSIVGRFQLYSREASLDLTETYGGDRVSLRRLTHNGIMLSIGLVHLVDKRNSDQHSQTVEAILLSDEIRRQEQAIGHDRTILIGDFNMNPFEPAMNQAAGLNAMMTLDCVRRESRNSHGKRYPFFYNPMWSFFGDRTPGASGTYYHSKSGHGYFGWNMLDQVLVRPSAASCFSDVKILTMAGDERLHAKSGRPRRQSVSDHFPILVELK